MLRPAPRSSSPLLRLVGAFSILLLTAGTSLGQGILEKTPYSYLAREASDVISPIDYSTNSWSAEIAMDFDPAKFVGDYGEFFRHGQSSLSFNPKAIGWSFLTHHEGYTPNGTVPILGSVSDGLGQNITVYTPVYQTGRVHLVMTYDLPTRTLKLFLNGALVSTGTSASLSLPATFPGELAIGATNKIVASYAQPNKLAMPRLDVYFARVWNGALSDSTVAGIYSNWNSFGITTSPTGISQQPVIAYYMDTEAGDKTGSAGTGWIKDRVGGNHLKIVEISAGAGPISRIMTPSGSVRGVSPADGASQVSGAAKLVSDGVIGSGRPMRYQFELDEVASFSSPALRSSGWVHAKPEWQPLLKPNQTYFWRVRGQDSSITPTTSAWSPVYSFTTRSNVDWYVRPPTTPGTYGTEDGSTFQNAWNDLRHNGAKGGLGLAAYKAQANFEKVAPGDSVIVGGDWGLMQSDTLSLAGVNPQVRLIKAKGLSDAYPIFVRFGTAQIPFKFYRFFRFTGNYAWVSEGNGVYSTTSFYDSAGLGIDEAGRPSININDPTSDTLLYRGASAALTAPGFFIDYTAKKMYVRMPDGLSPANKLWFLTGSVETFNLNLIGSKYLRLVGGEFYGTAPMLTSSGTENTNIYLQDLKIKYYPGAFAFQIGDFTDNITFDNVELSFAPNGIYGTNTGDPATRRTGDFITVRNCYFHHIGVGAFTDGDSHAVGIQAGDGWVVEDNLFEYTGTAIEAWDSGKGSKDHKFRRNVIRNVQDRQVTFGAGIGLTNGGVALGKRTGIEITDNVIIDTDGSGMHISVADPVLVRGNLVMRTGKGPEDYTWNGISFQSINSAQPAQASISSNVVIDPHLRFVSLGGNGDLTNSAVSNNLYWGTPPVTSAEANRFAAAGLGVFSFDGWKQTKFDNNSLWAKPSSTNLPQGFEPLKYDLFLSALPGDVNKDGVVNQTDLSSLLAAPSLSPGGQNRAYVRYLSILLGIASPGRKPGAPTNFRTN